jgi:hypothetical protein
MPLFRKETNHIQGRVVRYGNVQWQVSVAASRFLEGVRPLSDNELDHVKGGRAFQGNVQREQTSACFLSQTVRPVAGKILNDVQRRVLRGNVQRGTSRRSCARAAPAANDRQASE